ncbi:MAG: helix-turn-helix domain-containing protein [Ilumatobacteraceae bacterium]
MNPPVTSGGDESDLQLREQLSNLQALLALSMRMTDSEDEERILRLAGTAVPSLARCRLVGAHLADDGWYMAEDGSAETQVRADVEVQLAVVSTAGGAIAVGHAEWGWAFPLRSVGRHLGFLAVSADAEPTAPEQFLLRVLAQQTGVALANARLHSQQRRQANELTDINLRLERSTAIHDSLTQVAFAGEGQQGIAEAVHKLTGFAVAIEDRYGNLRAWAGPERPDPYPKQSHDQREGMVRDAIAAVGPIRHGGRLVVAAQPREDVVGILALVDPDDEAGDDARVAIEHAATVLAIELGRLSSIADTELRLRRDLVVELLAGTDETSAIARAEALGYDLQRPYRVVVVETGPDAPDPYELVHAVRRAARDCGVATLLATSGQSVVLLADTDRPWELFRVTVGRELRDGRCRVGVGVGGHCDRVADFPRSHREAVQALRLQTVVGGDRAIVFDDLGVYQLLADIDDLDSVDRFVHRWLGVLLDYDANKVTSDLITTLGQYLECGGNYDATAHALSVHRSTLKYRLQRIREISGHDLGSPDVRFNLQLAVRAWRTQQAVRGAPT